MRFTRLGIVLILAALAFGQQGIAPNRYYPRDYQGATFTGEVIDGPLDVITLRYTKRSQQETFSGRFEVPCAVPTKDHKMGAMSASDVNVGDAVTVYYFAQNIKKDGRTIKENVIVFITFDAVSGKIVPAEKRRTFPCTRAISTVYKAFGASGAIAVAPGPYQK
jgi:hypothetical protein